MKLELGKVHVKDVQFGDSTRIEQGVLYVNEKELVEKVLADDRKIGRASCRERV